MGDTAVPVCIWRPNAGGSRGGGLTALWGISGHRVAARWHTFVLLQPGAVLLLGCALCSRPQRQDRESYTEGAGGDGALGLLQPTTVPQGVAQGDARDEWS